ncbi:hypothetical protein PV325_013058 [Microctonus aethiopoides]|nr:hypothetical protein PV325_013058 [Microctonus aethiopoides]
MAKLKQFGKINDTKNDNVNKKFLNEKRPCSICDKLGFKNRFHVENICGGKKRIVLPLIKVKIFANGCPAIGLYDSGSNVSLVNSKFLSDKKNIKQIIGGRDTIKGLAGMAKTEGVVRINIKICNLEEKF